MEFVAIDTGIAGDTAPHILATRLRVRLPEAVGYLTLVFAGMALHREDGDLSKVLDSQLEKWACWHGKPGALAVIVREQLCDPQGVVKAWERWNGAMIRKAKADRDRKRAARDPSYRSGQSTDSPRNGARRPVERRGDGAGTVPDLTVPNQLPLPTTGTPSQKREGGPKPPKVTWLTPIGEVWEARYDKGSFPWKQAAREIKPLADAGHTSDEIARRLDFYLANKGLESVVNPDELRRRHFTPSLKDFRQRFGQFDPSAPGDV